jgi:hypothetical protein
MTRGRDRQQPSDPIAVAQYDIEVQAGQRGFLESGVGRSSGAGCHGSPRAPAQLRHRLRVIEVVVRQHDGGDPAALLRRLPHAFDVRRLGRAGVDHPRRRPDQPRVGARERHRARVRRAHERDALRYTLCDLGHAAKYALRVGSAR